MRSTFSETLLLTYFHQKIVLTKQKQKQKQIIKETKDSNLLKQ